MKRITVYTQYDPNTGDNFDSTFDKQVFYLIDEDMIFIFLASERNAPASERQYLGYFPKSQVIKILITHSKT